MPLTDREKQILDEIEQNLYSEDPGLARQIREPWWRKLRQVKVGAGLVVVGVACLIAGFVVNDLLLVLGFVAFVMMLLGIVLLSTATHDIAKDRVALGRSASAGPVFGSASDKLAAWQEKLRQRYKKQP